MSNAVFLDDHARGVLLTMLGGLPGLLTDLDVTLTRAHRLAAGAQVGRSQPGPRLPYHLGAAAAIDNLEVVLRVFTASIGAGASTPSDPIEQARWLYARLPGVPGDHPGLEGMATAVSTAVAEGFAVIDRAPDRLYLGLCDCGVPLYAAPEDTYAACRCGIEVAVTERRAQMLEQARFRFRTAGELARTLAWFAGWPITADAITKAGQRGKIPRITAGGHVLYRVGDVVDWHLNRHQPAGSGDG